MDRLFRASSCLNVKNNSFAESSFVELDAVSVVASKDSDLAIVKLYDSSFDSRSEVCLVDSYLFPNSSAAACET